MKKTVYILGAGFSAPAGGPAQNAILEDIFRLTPSDAYTQRALDSLRDFMTRSLGIVETQLSQYSLEDLFTPIDRCLADGTSFRGRSPSELQEIKQHLELLIAVALDTRFRARSGGGTYIADFAAYVISILRQRAKLAEYPADGLEAKAYDPLSIISLNWDILLDNALNQALLADNSDAGLYDPFGVVDYCCYVSSLERDNFRIRAGLWSLGCRGYNVKLLKIHGSMNWLQCSGCQRLYIEFDEKLNIQNYINARLCRHCQDHDHQHKLRSSLVMPTFLKDLSNFQLKVVWHNAGVELMEARHLVFIGYSLPTADFEFRQLLARMIHKDATLEVVLWNDRSAEGESKYQEEVGRYTNFFSGHDLKFEPGGVIAHVKNLKPIPVTK